MNAMDLAPCPFCGGEAEVTCLNKGQYQARAGCGGCGATINRFFRSKADAAEAWNARWERTCHMDYMSLYDEEGADGIECDECGWSELYDPGYPRPAHCPGCGAKVVGR